MNANLNLPESNLQLLTELQSSGLRLASPQASGLSRRGGAGPSDHKAIVVDGVTLMVPVHTNSAFHSEFVAAEPDANGTSVLKRGTIPVASVTFAKARVQSGLRSICRSRLSASRPMTISGSNGCANRGSIRSACISR